MKNIKNKDDFIKQSKLIHKDKYDYNKVIYEKNYKKVIIICKIHGDFLQTPRKHITRKQGCIICAGVNKKTTEEFIKQAKEKYKDKFDYSKTKYINSKTKLIIICKIHGEIIQTPESHLRTKYGCIKCSGVNKKTTEEFIKQAKEKYKDKYGYNKVKYKNAHSKIIITCKKHGDFKQTPAHFLYNDVGCNKCFISKAETLIIEYLDNMKIKYKYQKYHNFLGKKIYFDFYLIDINIYIEYDGEQHFLDNKFNDKYSSITNKNNDIFKNCFICNKNKILLRIHYKDKNNIIEIINNFIKNKKKPNIYYSRNNYY